MVFWRHGRTAWNVDHRFQGHSDVALDEVGISQARAAATLLARMSPSKIVSSDLERAVVTAHTLADRLGLPVVVDAKLRETHGGTWEGLNRSELESAYGDELAAWAAGSNLAPGGGERRTEVAARMTTAIQQALADVPDSGVLVVVTHGGSARAVICSMLELPIEHWGIFGVLSNCAWCVLTETDGHTSTAQSFIEITALATARFPDIPPQPAWRLVEYNARTLPEVAIGDDR